MEPDPKTTAQDETCNAIQAENDRFETLSTFPDMWRRFCPQNVADDPVLGALRGFLEDPDTIAVLDRCDAQERYPDAVISGMKARGLSDLFTGVDGGKPTATAYHLSALNLLTSRANASLAITVGVNTLALLPAYRGASATQLDTILRHVSRGEFCALALSELENGSDLSRNASYFESGRLTASGSFQGCNDDHVQTHYRLFARKQLINGAMKHPLQFLLLRDGSGQSGPGKTPRPQPTQTMFWLRTADTQGALRWKTGPVRAADISSVELDGVLVEADQQFGPVGQGFKLIKHSLAISRGGVCALSVGVLARAFDLALAYATRRQVKGAAIASFGVIGRHLCDMDAMMRVATAVSLRATAWVNATGERAAPYTAVAKYLGCRLAEEGVTEGRHILGARALLRDLPYERLTQDVLLFGVFDGTSHLMLDELQTILSIETRRSTSGTLAAADTLETTRAVYCEPPQSLVQAGRIDMTLHPSGLVSGAMGLARLSDDIALDRITRLAQALIGICSEAKTQGKWHHDQALRFALAEAYACLDASLALAEIFDPNLRHHLMDNAVSPLASDDAGYRHAMAWIGGRACSILLTCLAETGLTPFPIAGSQKSVFDDLTHMFRDLRQGQDERRKTLAVELCDQVMRPLAEPGHFAGN